MTQEKATISYQGKILDIDVLKGKYEDNCAIDISSLRSSLGLITLDPGLANTGSCTSKITYLNGEKGILEYRGNDIASLAKEKSFEDVSFLLVFGKFPTKDESKDLHQRIRLNSRLTDDQIQFLSSLPKNLHPMAKLSASMNVLDGFFDLPSDPLDLLAFCLGQMKCLVASFFHTSINSSLLNTKDDSFSSDFLQMTFGKEGSKATIDAMNVLLILHADHEQNCSTSAVRFVGSSQANLTACIASGIAALSGPLHGGANQAVLEMLETIHTSPASLDDFISRAKDKNDSFRLMGFGHRVYKNFDPRATIIKQQCDNVLSALNIKDPLLELAKDLEKKALEDSYFQERKLYPNVDFYSGIIYKALGFPVEMFTTLFSLGRMPGWFAHWFEMKTSKETRITRPRQVYLP